jgi:hypothetical protein
MSMNDTSDMILPEGFEAPTETTTNEPINKPAQPEAGLNMPGADDSGTTTPGIEKPPAAELPKFKVKFNHEEQELGYDEAVPLIQKGMNYDKLQERFNSIQSDPRLGKYDRVTEVSKLLGYQTDDALVEALFNTYYENIATRDGLTVDQVRKDAELIQRETALTQKEQNDARVKAENAMYAGLLKAFPDIKATDVKPETWARVKQGMDLTAAYIEQRNQDLEAQVKVMKQNVINARTAPVGSVTAHGSAEAAHQDPFLMGFESIN